MKKETKQSPTAAERFEHNSKRVVDALDKLADKLTELKNGFEKDGSKRWDYVGTLANIANNLEELAR